VICRFLENVFIEKSLELLLTIKHVSKNYILLKLVLACSIVLSSVPLRGGPVSVCLYFFGFLYILCSLYSSYQIYHPEVFYQYLHSFTVVYYYCCCCLITGFLFPGTSPF
jgi:hypothetical protein